ncbi:hypothetical protein BH11ARM2_BH11ARM2_15030 [soil metagenome]
MPPSSSEIYASLLEALEQPLAIVDGSGKILASNSTFRLTFGKLEEDIGNLFDDADRNELSSLLADGGEGFDKEAVFQTKQEENAGLRALAKVKPLRGTAEVSVLFSFMQIESANSAYGPPSELEKIRAVNEELERRVQVRTTELQAANRELETFNYSVSHDLRAPIRTILGFGSALVEDYGDSLGEDGLDYIDRMNRAARRIDELITAILGLSRLSRAKMLRANTNLSEIARSVGRDQEKIYPNAKLIVEEGINANADPGLARAIIANLIENGFKFTSRSESPEVWVSTEERNGRIYLKVSDNGIGFDPKYKERIFESFERLQRESDYPGTGIGLSTVLRAVRRHGGEVIAEGVPDGGATFLVWFGEQELDTN